MPPFEDLLVEGEVYIVQDFQVKHYIGDETNRATRNDKHNYTGDTKMAKNTIPSLKFPYHSFDLFNLDELDSMKTDNCFLTGNKRHIPKIFSYYLVHVFHTIDNENVL